MQEINWKLFAKILIENFQHSSHGLLDCDAV